MRRLLLSCTLAAAGGRVVAADLPPTQPALISTKEFAALPLLRKPQLSPNGHRIVARSVAEGKTMLVIVDADKPESARRSIALGKTTIAGLEWAGDGRLLLTIRSKQKLPYEDEIAFLRLIAIDVDSGAFRVVDGKSRGLYAGDVLYADPMGNWALVASQDSADVYPSVKRVDLATGNTTVVEKARPDVWDWYADEKGVVRAGIAYDGDRFTVWYRDTPEEKLRAVRGKFPKNDDSAVDRFIFRGGNSWVVTNERTGRFGLYKYDLKTGATGQAIFENPKVDLDDVLYNPISGEISAIEYNDVRPRVQWLEADMQKLQQRLDHALPAKVNVTTDWSRDEKRVLVWSGGASDPGLFYLLDRSTSQMHPVIDPYPGIDPDRLSEVRAVTYQARDGLSIPAYLTLPRGREPDALPLILFPHGGPHSRDDGMYDGIAQFLASRGYMVLQPEFRGSTGYGKDFAGKGYGEWGKAMQDDLDDGVNWLAKTGQIDPKRVCIVGASYGGYAAMWGAVRNSDRYRCAASWAGVSDLPAMLRYDRKTFSATRYFKKWRSKVSGEGKADLSAVSPINFATQIKIPIFIAHGEQDDNVLPKQSHVMVDALTRSGANVTSMFYKDSSHDFGSSADLEDWLRRLEAFLAKYNPA
jgi:dipeptidyl aminopeptidase/acylaminoacyl peptidase